MGQPMTPATPSTPAQRERYDRVLTTAAAILSGGGEEALQMKDLAQRADVSLATLYRYFPSKDHVLLAISLDNYQAAARKVLQEVPRGKTARERVTNHMLREFRAQQRNQRLTTALTKVLTETSRNYSEIIEVIGHVHVQILQHVAAAGPGRSASGSGGCCRSSSTTSARPAGAGRPGSARPPRPGSRSGSAATCWTCRTPTWRPSRNWPRPPRRSARPDRAGFSES